jgi:hypothetical protein
MITSRRSHDSMISNCPKCNSTLIQVCQGGTRCGACGHQESGVSPHLTKPQSYISHPSPGSNQVYRHSLHECEDIEELQRVLTERKNSAVVEPKISIIMPTFKRQHTIYTTIASILRQTVPDWELIVIDNEPDSNYKFDDPRIRYYKDAKERGAGYGRNAGIKYVTADLVCFFDDDDIMMPNYLECMLAPFMRDEKMNMVLCKVRLVEGRISNCKEFCTPTVVVKKSFVKPVWEGNQNHDISFFSDIYKRIPAESIIEIPEVLVHAYTSSRGGIREGAL